MEQNVSRALYAIAYRFGKPSTGRSGHATYRVPVAARDTRIFAGAVVQQGWVDGLLRHRAPSPTPPNRLPLASMALNVTDLACARGPTQVLANVSFSVAEGEALILRGPNGAGKTTLLRTLAGLTPPLAGTVACADGAIAYAGHADGLKAQLTVAENLSFWAGIFGTATIAEAMAAFDLKALAHRRAGELSAGQKRRLSLARLLVTGRPIWCLDEPTVSLDAANTQRFAAAVQSHLSHGGSALIATHIDLGLAAARTLDIAPFVARGLAASDPFAEAFT